jgi:hypothetical protein
MYKKVINELKSYILEKNKLSFLEIISLSLRICLAIYLPASLVICLFVILKNMF